MFTCAVAGKTAASQASFPLNSTKISPFSSLKKVQSGIHDLDTVFVWDKNTILKGFGFFVIRGPDVMKISFNKKIDTTALVRGMLKMLKMLYRSFGHISQWYYT